LEQPELASRFPSSPPRRPAVSVCIVNWNCRELLRACLRSLTSRRQGVSVEVVVVDNASTDGAAEMVHADFPRVRLIRNTCNAGFAHANNQAARQARGRYLFFLNNDTVVPRRALARLLAYARSHPEAGLIGPALCDPRGRCQRSFRCRPALPALLHRTCLLGWTGLFRQAHRRYGGRDGDFHTTRPVEVLMGAALLVRRRLLLQSGLWDEGYPFGGEDVELCTRLARTHQVVYHPAVTIIHHGRASSRQRVGPVHTNHLIGLARYLRCHGTSRLGLFLYRALMTVDAPLQWLAHLGGYLWCRLRGQSARAAYKLRRLEAVSHFLTRGLLAFWRA